MSLREVLRIPVAWCVLKGGGRGGLEGGGTETCMDVERGEWASGETCALPVET